MLAVGWVMLDAERGLPEVGMLLILPGVGIADERPFAGVADIAREQKNDAPAVVEEQERKTEEKQD